MKKLVTGILIFVMLTVTLCGTAAYASFGMGTATVANDVKLIKTGILGRKITFSDADFKQGLCITELEAIKIVKLPATSDGTLLLAGRRVGEGTTIKRKNIAALVFIPTSKDVTETSFFFTAQGYADGAEIEFVLKFTDKVNYEPEVNSEYAESSALKTQRDIGIYGKMYAKDGEGDELEYMIVSYPKHGTLTKVDAKSGEYVYTPRASYTGQDEFIYVVRDEWGNFSKTQTVSITVTERMSEVVYQDMKTRPEYNAAVAMTAMGIMNGKIVGDGVYFDPDGDVSRAEFVAMAMKALGVKADSTLSATYFDDNAAIPTALCGYIATAQKTGIISGYFEGGKLLFKPNETITKYDAAVIMAKLVGAKAEGELPVFSDMNAVPTWARASVLAMCSLGIFEYSGNTVNADDTVTRADCANYLYKMISK